MKLILVEIYNDLAGIFSYDTYEMMFSIRHMRRFFAVLMIAVWGFAGITAPAHAAEEDIHHATQHDGGDETATTDNEPVDEGSVHPEHATHCHAGACHFHAMSRGALSSGVVKNLASVQSWPQDNIIPQIHLSSLFRPPRI